MIRSLSVLKRIIACALLVLGLCCLCGCGGEVADSGCIVFLGDSLTDFGYWETCFPWQTVYNHGVAGDTVLDILDRVDDVKRRQPSKVFVMGGTNDLLQGESIETIMERWGLLLDALNGDYEVYVQSIPPFESYFGVTAEEIQRLNLSLRTLAEEYGVEFIDIYPLLADTDGYVREEYILSDGLHLSDAAYRVWEDAVRDLV